MLVRQVNTWLLMTIAIGIGTQTLSQEEVESITRDEFLALMKSELPKIVCSHQALVDATFNGDKGECTTKATTAILKCTADWATEMPETIESTNAVELLSGVTSCLTETILEETTATGEKTEA